tara:strand:- start:175 stop:591 length:417 start_codon:yes stop_codon:yes gene_type:complete
MKFASNKKRFLAFLIDYLILSIFFSIVWVLRGLEIPSENIQIGQMVIFNVGVWGWFIGIFYFGLSESGTEQASYGKRIMGIKVCNEKGERISTRKSMARNLNKFFSNIFLIGYIMIFFNKKNQTFHDYLSSVVIIESK